MKDNNIADKAVEELLKSRMDNLADSVDCFDKISRKAFPKSEKGYFEGGYVINDVENVTGRGKGLSILKWAAAASAAVVCIAVVPQTEFFNRIMQGTNVNDSFTRLTEEIAYETEKYDYDVYDVSLDYYIRNDILVTPMFPCPFKESHGEDNSVRIFVKNVNGTPTNQVYAVEYCGSYTEENFIAAASSGVEITEDDIMLFPTETDEDANSVANKIVFDEYVDNGKELMDSDNQIVNVASFYNHALYKTEESLNYFQNEVIYGNGEKNAFYDVIAYSLSERDVITERFAWETSMYINGVSALPKEEYSEFKRVELFSMDFSQESDSKVALIQPFSYENSDSSSEYDSYLEEMQSIPYNSEFEVKIRNNYEADEYITALKQPVSAIDKENLTLYFAAQRIYSSPSDFANRNGDSIILNGKKFTADEFSLSSGYLKYLEEYCDINYIHSEQGENADDIPTIEELRKNIIEYDEVKEKQKK